MTALELAEADHLVGTELDPLLGKRISDEVDRRCFDPFLHRHDFWWLHNNAQRTVNNWTAVCVGGVVGAATYLETDLARLAELIARGARSLDDYLSTFDADGGSSEGPGYWSYGYGYYTIVAHLVENRTDGQVSFLSEPLTEPLIKKVSSYPLRTVLGPDSFVNFSDCDSRVSLIAPHLAYLSRRLGIPDLMQLANAQRPTSRESQLTWGLRSLFWAPDLDAGSTFVPARHDFFAGMHWMLARENPADPDALVLAAKGGHNQEMHNQNDVGSVVVRYGGETLIPDIGRGRYTRAYFGPERYTHFVNSSLGHSVPVVNGLAQLAGQEHRAELLEQRATDTEDALVLEMRAAYPVEAGLASLRRTVALRHEAPRGWVELQDVATFAGGPGQLGSVLTTFSRVELAPGAVLIAGERASLRVAYDADRVTARLDIVPSVDLAEGPADVTRIVFSPKSPAQEVTIRLQIVPC
jgi:hypothetical protein